MSTHLVLVGDSRERLKDIPDNSIDSVVTDPPYDLTTNKKGGSMDVLVGTGVGGFMGMEWDATGIAFNSSLWSEVRRVLKPGGHLLAFGGTRTHHRMTCAIEDAGFEIRDELDWLYGSGFPKSLNLKDEWQGWGTALKPGREPIVMARKPFSTTVAVNVRAHGTGALNIDACRIDASSGGRWPANVILTHSETCECIGTRSVRTGTAHEPERKEMSRSIYGKTNTLGRTCGFGEDGYEKIEAWNCAEDCPIRQLDEQSGPYCGAAARVKGNEPSSLIKNTFGKRDRVEGAFHDDVGGASRFFYVAKTSTKERNAGCENLPDGNNHPTVKPIALMRYLCRLITPPGGTVLDPFAGSGSTGCAAVLEGFRFIGIELLDTHADIARHRIDYWQTHKLDAPKKHTAEPTGKALY